ncbi:hypothetical protein KP509_30G054400 [Ceratopteris richardii]|uniref:Uncharacterized protein n=1 Tax=Ceratopteris richardii TaxID=49495 RepID=A0A8T2R2H2_CERRI|nr:hypothetical protein KP509_30G054400 [Ceratopteris richardii]
MASSLRLACILVLFVALVVAHSAAFAADMEDKGRKLASDSSGTKKKEKLLPGEGEGEEERKENIQQQQQQQKERQQREEEQGQ